MLIAPWRYAPVSDSDGERIGTDHFILDANGDEVGVARTAEEGLLTAAGPDLLAELVNTRLELLALRDYLAVRGDPPIPSWLPGRIESISAAIAKATQA